jgi:hypothetical protein
MPNLRTKFLTVPPLSFSEPKPARRNDPILVAEPKPHVAAELAYQPIQRCRRIRNTAIFSNFASLPALGHRHNDRVLMNVQPGICDTIWYDLSPMT